MAGTRKAGRRDNVYVVITTYNRAGYLEALLESLRALHPAPRGVVVVDNASTDATESVIAAARDSFAALPVPLPVIHHRLERNVGGAGGFSAGI